MGLLVGTAFAIWVVYSFSNSTANSDSPVAFVLGVVFVLWLVSSLF